MSGKSMMSHHKMVLKILSTHRYVSEITLDYNSFFFFPMEKVYPFTFSEYLAYVGGIMGLLAGVSVLSLIEIVFHLLMSSTKKASVYLRSTRVLPMTPKRSVEQARTRNIKADENHILYQFSKYVADFMKKSDVHGLNYTIDKNQSMFGRVLWTIIIIGSVVSCYVLVKYSYDHSEKNPVIISIDKKTWNIENVNFLQKLLASFTFTRVLLDSFTRDHILCWHWWNFIQPAQGLLRAIHQ